MAHESIDISQLKDLALWGSQTESASRHVDFAPSFVPQPGQFAASNNLQRHGTTETALVAPLQERKSQRKRISEPGASKSSLHASNSTSGSAKTRMSDGTQKSASTEVLSQWVYENTGKPSSNTRPDGQNGTTPQTYKPGEEGYVGFDKLSGLFEDKKGEQEELQSQDSALLDVSSPIDALADVFQEPQPFRPPETPATHGRKRDHNGNVLENAFTTPRLPPLNPFGNGDFNGAGISISQAFKLTQAPSSPFTNVIPSDGTSSKPTPGMQYANRPSTAGPSSSPAKMERTSMKRSVTEPYTRWNETQESDKVQKTSSPIARMSRSSPTSEYGLLDDDFSNTQVRLFKERRRDQTARRQLSHMIAKESTLLHRANGIRKSPRNALIGRSQLSQRASREPVIISDGPISSESEEETEHEEVSLTPEQDDGDELAEDNKENAVYRPVQVPRTVGRSPVAKRTIRQHPQSSPIGQKSGLHQDDSSSDELANTDIQGAAGSSCKSKSRSSGAQRVAIADSQGSPHSSQTKGNNCERALVPGSSIDSKGVIRESQTFKAPSTSQLDSSITKRMVNQPSSSSQGRVAAQLASSPRKLSGSKVAADALYSAAEQACHPLSSSPRAAKPRKVDHNTNIVDLGSDDVVDTDNGARRPGPKLRKRTLSDHRKAGPSNLDTVSITGPHDTPLAHSATFSSTIPETESLRRYRSDLGGSTGNLRLEERNISSGTSTSTRNKDTRSTISSRYEAARTNLGASPGKSREQASVTEPMLATSNNVDKAKPKSMKEIAAVSTSQDDVEDMSLSIDLFTKEDMEFNEQMEPFSSPVPPGRKKVRGRNAQTKAKRDKYTAYSDETTLAALSSQERNQRSGIEVTMADDSLAQSRPHDSIEKENVSSPGRMIQRVQGVQTGGQVEVQVSDDQAARVDKQSMVSGGPRARSKGEHHSTTESKTTADPEDITLSKPTEDPTTPGAGHGAGPPKAYEAPGHDTEPDALALDPNPDIKYPMRVFAFLRYKYMAFYPATCVAFNSVQSTCNICFEDGSESTVPLTQVKQLELRQGDNIKINRVGLRTTTFTVQSLERQENAASEPSEFTDIHGNTHVVVVSKSNIRMKANEQQVFPITAVYFLGNLRQQFLGRIPAFAQDTLPATDNIPDDVPVTRSSSPVTPMVRQRSAKAASKVLSASRISSISNPRGGLFANFIFAITSIGDDSIRENVKSLIQSNGGRVLKNGYEELFTFSPTLSSRATTPSTRSSRASTPSSKQPHHGPSSNGQPLSFRLSTNPSSPTLLLADRHSRNNKYFQALSLGVPCIHRRWVTDCLTQRKLLDWRCYLLASGESSFLEKDSGGAKVVLSQMLPHITDTSKPEQWSLQKAMDNRSKWLDGKRVLIVSAGPEKPMEAYAFIALAMGANEVVVADSKREARCNLYEVDSEGEIDMNGAKGCRWDWVCVDKEDGGKPAPKRTKTSRSSSGSKAERVSLTDAEMIEGLDGVKVVGTECVVQSLILGRLLDPSEL